MKGTVIKIKHYQSENMPNLKDIISKNLNTWKIQPTIAINFMFPKDNDEECMIQLKSDNREIN